MQANEHVILNSDNCAQLYAHEATRVFHDRLVDAADRRTFYELLADNLHDYFKVILFSLMCFTYVLIHSNEF